MSEDEHEPEPATPSVVWRAVHGVLAGLFLVVAVIGAILPVLPTTPFVLLASFHLSRASPRLDAALRRSRWFGPVLADWNERGGVRPGVKWLATTVVLLVVALTVWFGGRYTVIPVVVLAAIGLVVVWRLPVVRDEPLPDPESVAAKCPD